MRQDKRIIVEGFDGAGKTTLISKLIYDFDYQFDLIRNELGPDQDFNKWWPEQLERPKSAVIPIHDRFFFSELIYGPILRGSIAADEGVVGTTLWFLRNTAFLIYARPASDIILTSLKMNDQMSGVREKSLALLGSYDNLMASEMGWFDGRFARYDWTDPTSYPQLEEMVRSYLNG